MAKIKKHQLKPQYFLIIFIISSAVSLGALRSNNQHMVKFRETVYVADKNNTDIKQPLKDLQAYVTTHMNTDLSTGPNSPYPPIQLKYTYDRLVKANSKAVSDANSKIYSEAQKSCEAQNSNDFSGRNRVPCIEQYVNSHKSGQPSIVSDSLYKFSFLSPKWSPDLAGWSIVVAILSFTLFIITFIKDKIKK